MLATCKSSTAAIPEPINLGCITAVTFHFVLQFLHQESSSLFGCWHTIPCPTDAHADLRRLAVTAGFHLDPLAFPCGFKNQRIQFPWLFLLATPASLFKKCFVDCLIVKRAILTSSFLGRCIVMSCTQSLPSLAHFDIGVSYTTPLLWKPRTRMPQNRSQRLHHRNISVRNWPRPWSSTPSQRSSRPSSGIHLPPFGLHLPRRSLPVFHPSSSAFILRLNVNRSIF